MHDDPLATFQEVLDIQSNAYVAGDFEKLLSTVNLPYWCRFRTFGTLVETKEDLEKELRTFSQSLVSLGVNQFIRLSSDADSLGTDYVQGHYVTHCLRNATPMMPSYTSRMVLQRHDRQWRAIEIETDLDLKAWPLDLMRVPKGAVVKSKTQQDDVRRWAADPHTLYQNFIDKLTKLAANNDFEGYCAMCRFPYSTHGATMDHVLETPDEVKPFFDMIRKMVDGTQADTMERRADKAEFIGADLICGYHTARFYKDNVESLPPIKSRMILKRDGTQWRLLSVTNSIANENYPFAEVEPAQDLVTQREIQQRTKAWPTLQ